ncbi:FdtA/QdtA family cupin domain-containing protein [Aestuariivirga sp.]|uniref:sugar 3,4-ketoisomerase n=1 Tax=Aestuariivirga sp. TaxID=2650926 RepID=UPI003593EDB3
MNISSYVDARGNLSVIEVGDLPFTVRRIYYLHGVPLGATRGEHGHKLLEQLMICMHGSCEVTLNDGQTQEPFKLSLPSVALYVPPGMWRSLRFVEPDTVCCVLASKPYEKEDYIYDFEDFLAWSSQRSPDRSHP